MSGFGIASEKVPTMKSEGGSDSDSVSETAGDNNGFFTPNEKIDFSKVDIEPLFADEVDFETFSRSDFRAVKVKECSAVPKSKKLLQIGRASCRERV